MAARKFRQGDRVRHLGRGRRVYVVDGFDEQTREWTDSLVHLREEQTGQLDCAYESRLRRVPVRSQAEVASNLESDRRAARDGYNPNG